MKNIIATFREGETEREYDLSAARPSKAVALLGAEERERRRKNYDAVRGMLAIVTGSNEWSAYTYSELLEGARNALAAESLRIQ